MRSRQLLRILLKVQCMLIAYMQYVLIVYISFLCMLIYDILYQRSVLLCFQKECENMFKVDNSKIGNYISRLIEGKFDSARKFCIAYLEVAGNEDATEDDIKKMANRISQIKKGKKAIQIYDLPIFSELLDVSFEQILSAGTCGVPKSSRMTNYSIAQSHNKKEWIAYIERDDKPILNPDEYGKTVLEYAIEFSNYDFLKFLMDKNYIWFDSRKDKDYCMTFGAGTSIQRIKFEEVDHGVFIRKEGMDDFQYKLATEDQLRMYIICFAADHDDLKTLEKLRAREIPELYCRAHYISRLHPDLDAHYDKSMVSHIAKCSNEVLDYFTDPFEIRDHIRYKDGSKRKHTFMFPYISELLDMLIENNSPFLTTALEKSIAHNEKTMEKLNALIKQSINNDCYDDYWKEEFLFNENGNIISYREVFSNTGIITNIVNAKKKSKDVQVNSLIEKLNESYNSIRHIKVKEMATT